MANYVDLLGRVAEEVRAEYPPTLPGQTADAMRAVAEWLDYCATYREGVDPGSYASAVLVARAYLGEST